jgi:hypothetical protein
MVVGVCSPPRSHNGAKPHQAAKWPGDPRIDLPQDSRSIHVRPGLLVRFCNSYQKWLLCWPLTHESQVRLTADRLRHEEAGAGCSTPD